jgi:hypothetical protein
MERQMTGIPVQNRMTTAIQKAILSDPAKRLSKRANWRRLPGEAAAVLESSGWNRKRKNRRKTDLSGFCMISALVVVL